LFAWLNGLVVSALGIRARDRDSRVVPQFHLVATLGKLFTHISAPWNSGTKWEFSAP